MNLRALVHLFRDHGTEVILVTPASNLLQAPGRTECGDIPEDDCAGAQYRFGKQLSGSDPDRAVRYLTRAMDLDPLPIRAPSDSVELTRRVATEEGTRLVDAYEELPRAGVLDVPASGAFFDHVHLSKSGHESMARLLAPVVLEVVGTPDPARGKAQRGWGKAPQ
jgi:hypothetical protein